MKHLLILAVMLGALGLSAQEYKHRQPNPNEARRLAGVVNHVQDEFDRLQKPVILTTGLLSYNLTNVLAGVVIVASTNITALVHIGLPNPTNNYGRRFEIVGNGPVSVVLTNTTFTGTFTSNLIVHTSYLVSSNRTINAWSTGTNYICRDY